MTALSTLLAMLWFSAMFFVAFPAAVLWLGPALVAEFLVLAALLGGCAEEAPDALPEGAVTAFIEAMEEDEEGRWWLPDLEYELPMTFSLKATLPA